MAVFELANGLGASRPRAALHHDGHILGNARSAFENSSQGDEVTTDFCDAVFVRLSDVDENVRFATVAPRFEFVSSIACTSGSCAAGTPMPQNWS